MSNLESLGTIVRKLRQESGLPLRKVAAFLDIDQAILSKIERGKRNATRKQVVMLAGYFQVKEEELLSQWLSDKLVYQVADELLAEKALQIAEEKIAYKRDLQKSRGKQAEKKPLFNRIKNYFQLHENVKNAWVFGSYARNDAHPGSDIDILIDVPTDKKFTLYDMAQIQEDLEKMLGLKADVVMLKGLDPAIRKKIQNEMRLIYEAK
jgi:predicted nucleotidyltransferase/plasmid maintenance system antidote protein VapI